MMMEFESFRLNANDGKNISAGSWIPKEEPKGILCIVHGIGEHFRRYTDLATFFCSKDFAVYAYDQRGHGNSEGKRGHASSYSLLLDDVENILKSARSEYPDLPLILMGHSWGGNIVANYIIKRPTKEVNAAILSSPWLKPKHTVRSFSLLLAGYLKYVFPSVTFSNKLLPRMLAHDPEVIKNYINDPLVHSRLSLTTYLQGNEAGRWALENAHKLEVPTLVMHGKEDEITSWEASATFVKNAGKFASLKLWDGAKHEPHNDWEKQSVYYYLCEWIYQTLPDFYELT